MLFGRPLVSIGFAQSSLARFSVSEEFMSASEAMHPSDAQMYADELRYQTASPDPTRVQSESDGVE
jgi:NADH dehydrogenase